MNPSQAEYERLAAENGRLRAEVAELSGELAKAAPWRQALSASELGLFVLDLATGALQWDEAMQRLHGRSTPNTFQDFVAESIHPDDRSQLLAKLQKLTDTGNVEGVVSRIVHPQTGERWLLSNGSVIADEQGKPARLVGGVLDVTQYRMVEERLRQSQKMEAIGSLTAGIAHNFNNMLTVIMPALELLEPTVTPQWHPLVREASHASRRACELVRQLVMFAGRSRSNLRGVHNIEQIVESAVAICRRSFEPRLSLHCSYEGPPSNVLCDPGQIEQALVNLLINARDAVAEGRSERGHVRVRVSRLPSLPAAQDGARERTCIQVIDDGVGMTKESIAKVFEPFFTTKGMGRGTGLGLATSFGIVREHGGMLSCESAPGEGAVFTMLLPLSDAPPHPEPARLAKRFSKGLRALIIDDECGVRIAVSHLLLEAGLRVRSAPNAAEGLALVTAEPDIDVVLLDRCLPDGPGENLVPRIRALAPCARILFFCGYALDPEVAACVDGVVYKPASGADLLDAITRVLEQEPQRARSSG